MWQTLVKIFLKYKYNQSKYVLKKFQYKKFQVFYQTNAKNTN